MTHTMKRWQRWVFRTSRDPTWLWGALIAILALGVVGGLITERLGKGAETGATIHRLLSQPLPFNLGDVVQPDAVAPFRDEFSGETVELPQAFEWMSAFVPDLPPEKRGEARAIVEAAKVDEALRRLMVLTFDGLIAEPIAPPAELLALAESELVTPHANYALGVVYEAADRLAEARSAFEQEGVRVEATEARGRVVDLARRTRDIDALVRLSDDPVYAEHFDSMTRLDAAIGTRDWWRIFALLVPSIYEQADGMQVFLACVTGVLWFLLLVQLVQPASVVSARVWLCLIAFFLGVASVLVTFLAIIIEEEMLGFVERDDLAGGLVYMIAGVALREEVSKLLLFLPLVPILLRRGSQLEMLLVAGCVGLGFAAEENMHYFVGPTGGLITPARFLTANFLHISLTGLLGLSFCRIFIYRQHGLGLFVQTFMAVVVLHGLYNTLLTVPELVEISFVTFFCTAVLAFWFFRELRDLREERRDIVSPVATFVLGLALMLAVSLAAFSAEVGVRFAAQALAMTGIELALVAYLFLREMPGSLVTV